eukprot:comp22383_c0_seq1/m.54300 comp22383_c0_seq1/g.54300  ORF comp22383_c0_seq1/g.54300 comp22383_c0_seq1/m.54300 type:complete len:409 (+) comp22383_c0_seq1:629-1855(+)
MMPQSRTTATAATNAAHTMHSGCNTADRHPHNRISMHHTQRGIQTKHRRHRWRDQRDHRRCVQIRKPEPRQPRPRRSERTRPPTHFKVHLVVHRSVTHKVIHSAHRDHMRPCPVRARARDLKLRRRKLYLAGCVCPRHYHNTPRVGRRPKRDCDQLAAPVLVRLRICVCIAAAWASTGFPKSRADRQQWHIAQRRIRKARQTARAHTVDASRIPLARRQARRHRKQKQIRRRVHRCTLRLARQTVNTDYHWHRCRKVSDVRHSLGRRNTRNQTHRHPLWRRARKTRHHNRHTLRARLRFALKTPRDSQRHSPSRRKHPRLQIGDRRNIAHIRKQTCRLESRSPHINSNRPHRKSRHPAQNCSSHTDDLRRTHPCPRRTVHPSDRNRLEPALCRCNIRPRYRHSRASRP